MTNSLKFLSECDRIFVIDSGTIYVFNNFEELSQKEQYSEFLGKSVGDTDDEDLETKGYFYFT